jgi:hypothetical protein
MLLRPPQAIAITPEQAWRRAADSADDENTEVANSKLSIVEDQL